MDLRRLISRGLLIGAVLLTPIAAALAQSENPGKAMYLKYCGACHGESGKGDGAVSGFLRPKPTDLTQLAKQAGGAYPSAAVAQMIDGTKTVRAHGDPDMPVWGEIFREQAALPGARRAEAQAKVLVITDYLRTIQEK